MTSIPVAPGEAVEPVAWKWAGVFVPHEEAAPYVRNEGVPVYYASSIQSLREDAERYRFLRPRFRSHWATYRRDVVVASDPMVGVDIPDVFGKYGDPPPVIDIDAAIDAARKALEGK